MENKFSWIILVSFLFTFVQAQLPPFTFESPLLGNIRGSIGSTFNLDPYYQFQGIPYGDVQSNGRFLPSRVRTGRLEEGSAGYFDATTPGVSCVQPVLSKSQNHFNYGTLESFISAGGKIGNESNSRAATGQEDCLHINIFTRDVPTPENPRSAPVVVFIHGGAFITGSSNFYEGHRFLEEDVVLVTFNYRLGILGFFSLDTPEAPGNAAMYDMLNALMWIQAYIADFGGDPNSVTVIGQSAGAAALIHLMASPLAAEPTPLFHKAIVLSGTGSNEWGIVTANKAITASLRIAELVGCYTPVENEEPDTVAITTCMTNLADMSLIMDKMLEYMAAERYESRLGFDATSPVIQSENVGIDRIIEQDPQNVFEAGEQLQIPLMMGAMSHEGSFPLGVLYNNYLLPHSYHNNSDFLKDNLIPEVLRVFGIEDDSNAVYDAIAKTYLGDARHSGVFAEMMPGLLDLHSVFFFKADIYKTLQLHSKVVENSYWYSFDYRGPKTLFNLLFTGSPVPPVYGGISHGDDMLYLFAIPFFHSLNEEEMSVSSQIITYYTNFARTGEPNAIGRQRNVIHWPKYDPIQQKYISINVTFVEKSEYTTTWDSAVDILLPAPPIVSTDTDTETTTDEPTTPSTPSTPGVTPTTAPPGSSTSTAGSTIPTSPTQSTTPAATSSTTEPNSANKESNTVLKMVFVASTVIAALRMS